jgi:hypothetical protein
MMASSVHHADNAGRNDTLKWSIDEVSLMSFITCKQDPCVPTIDLSPYGTLMRTARREAHICRTMLEVLVGHRFTIQQCGRSNPFMRAVAISGERVHSIIDLSSYPLILSSYSTMSPPLPSRLISIYRPKLPNNQRNVLGQRAIRG